MWNHARWIWLDGDDLVNSYVLFSRSFSLKKTEPLTFRVSADSQYAAYVNGELACFGQYPDYPNYKVYDEVTLDPALLRVGENALEIVAYCQGDASSTYRPGRRGLIFELDGVLSSDEATRCARHPKYVSGPVEKISGQVSYSFRYDEAGGEPVWTTPKTRTPDAPLYPRPVKKLVMAEPVSPRVVSSGSFKLCGGEETSGARAYGAYLRHQSAARELPLSMKAEPGADGVYALVDLGREKSGSVYFDIDAPKGARVDVSFGEHLDDARPRAAVGGRNFAFTYVSDGRHTFLHPYKRLAGRYLQFHIQAHKAALYAADIRSCDYPFDFRARPEGLDRLETRIYDVCVDTLRLCAHEHYEDCPWREQALYGMDGRNQMLCGHYVFDNPEFVRASLRLLALGLREDGLLEMCAPALIPITIPSFSLMWIVSLAEYGEHTGDWDFVREMLPTAKRVLAACEARAGGNGLIERFEGREYWNFYEWSKGLDDSGIFAGRCDIRGDDALINAFFSLALGKLIFALEALGEDAARERARLQTHRSAYRAAYWTGSGFRFLRSDAGNGSEIIQALAVYAGLSDGAEADEVLGRIADGAYGEACTLSHSIFKYELMAQSDKYRDRARDEIAEVWGSMLYRGATSFWETIKGADDFDDAGSLCHGWSAIPAYLYHRYFCAKE